MPTYEYACKRCGHQFEVYQPITANALKRCPACKKLGLQRLISGGAGLIFKGSGFYETDYKRSAAYAKDQAAAASGNKPAESKPSDSKPSDSKSADGKKPADSKPAESKSGESKPAPTKSDAAKPKSESSKPAAAKSAKP